jgi:NTP pyrophosphatase (non-canonical NTP hydrolase)
MGSKAAPPPGLYVRQLVKHANRLRQEAREAFDAGDYERAAALLTQAEMLAADVGELVDAIEERQGADMMRLAASGQYDAAPTRRPVLTVRTRKLGAALGASLAMSLALVEC